MYAMHILQAILLINVLGVMIKSVQSANLCQRFKAEGRNVNVEIYFTAHDLQNHSVVCRVRYIADDKYEIEQIVTLPRHEMAFTIIYVPGEKKLYYHTWNKIRVISYLYEKSTENITSSPTIAANINDYTVQCMAYDYVKHKFYINLTHNNSTTSSTLYYFDTNNSCTPHELNYLRTSSDRLIDIMAPHPTRGYIYGRYSDCTSENGRCSSDPMNYGILRIDTREANRSMDIVRPKTLITYQMSALDVNEDNDRIYWTKRNDTYDEIELISSALNGSDIKKEFTMDDNAFSMMISNNRLYISSRYYKPKDYRVCGESSRLWRRCLDEDECQDTDFHMTSGNDVCIESFWVVESIEIKSYHGLRVILYCLLAATGLTLLGLVAYEFWKYYERRRNCTEEEVVHFHRHFQPTSIAHDSPAITVIT